MSSENFFSGMFQPVVLNTSGQITVAAGYKAKFYAAGTDIPQTIYTDSALLVPYASPSNIAFLDDTGKALIYLGLGGYKLVLTDPNDVPVAGYTIDNITGIGTFGTGFVNSFADLLNVNTNIFPYIYIGGYYTPGDGGEGMFYNKTSTTSADGGYVQDSAIDPSKKWFRIPDENGKVRAASFGYIGTDSSLQTTALQAADAYATSVGATLLILAGTSAQTGTINFSSPVVEFATTSAIKAVMSGSATVTFTGIVIAPAYPIFGDGITVAFSASQIAIPEWFGALTSAGDNAPYFTKLWASGAGGFKINPGTWTVASTTPPTNKRILSFGVVTDGVNTIIPIGEYYFTVRNLTVNGTTTQNGDVNIVGALGVTGTIGATAAISSLASITAEVDLQTLTGDVISAKDVTAGRNLVATTAVNAPIANLGTALIQSDSISGESGLGTPVGRIGNSASNNNYRSSGLISSPIIGTGSTTIDGNALVNNGDSMTIRIYGHGNTSAGTVSSLNVKIYSVSVCSAISWTLPNGNQSFCLTLDVTRTGTNGLYVAASVSGIIGDSNTADILTETSSATVTLTSSGTVATNFTHAVQDAMFIDYKPVY